MQDQRRTSPATTGAVGYIVPAVAAGAPEIEPARRSSPGRRPKEPRATTTPTERSLLMARVRSRDTAPEVAVRRAIHARGFRFRLHPRMLPGRPDIVLPAHRLAVFVHGCFWHGCPACDRGLRRPKTNAAFWDAKLAENRARDARTIAALKAMGWRVAVIWECAARDPARLAAELDRILPAERRHAA